MSQICASVEDDTEPKSPNSHPFLQSQNAVRKEMEVLLLYSDKTQSPKKLHFRIVDKIEVSLISDSLHSNKILFHKAITNSYYSLTPTCSISLLRAGGAEGRNFLTQMSTHKITKNEGKSLESLNIVQNTMLGALLKRKSQNVHYNLQRR